MATEEVRNGFRFITEDAPRDFGWLPKQEAAAFLKKSEKTLEAWSKAGKLKQRSTSENKVQYLVELPNCSEESNKNSDEIPKESEAYSEVILMIDSLKEEVLEIKSLKKELEETKQKLITATVELRLSQKDNETYSLLMNEKEKRITQLEDQVSQDKEHIQAERSRADMASNQLMNANALIKRRDDAPVQIPEPNQEVEALQAKIKELETQPWWRRIIK